MLSAAGSGADSIFVFGAIDGMRPRGARTIGRAPQDARFLARASY
jgi:hypothetical protein